MTMMSAKQVIAGLRRKIEEHEAKLETVINKVKEWEDPHQRDKHAAPSILHDLEGLLELPQEGDE